MKYAYGEISIYFGYRVLTRRHKSIGTQTEDRTFPTFELAQKEAKRKNARNFAGRIVGFWEVRQEGAVFVLVWLDPR